MSLFPAYSGTAQESTSQSDEVSDKEWLTNSSFAVQFPSETVKKKRKTENKILLPELRERKKAKPKKKKEQQEVVVEIPEDVGFEITTKSTPNLRKKKSVPSCNRPKYRRRFEGALFQKVKKKKKIKRYFRFKDNVNLWRFGDLDEEIKVSKKTKTFNEKINDDPHDIPTWIDFVNFQDEYNRYQHIRYKSVAERERATAYHKLNILDRAVTKNPHNKELQALWLKIGTSVLPSEEMSHRINKILKTSGGTMTLWLGLMTTTQHSLARCTVPSVTRMYEKLLLNFQKEKQRHKYERDLHVLELLFHYGRFLDHAGHWETLWLMIKVNLQFNTKVDLSIDIKVDDKVKELENDILQKEKQAIWKLWSQLERVREGYHFLPDPDSVDYPQRCVTPDSLVNFTWHFHPDLHFQLVVSFLVLLKVPLLPSTDTILNVLAPNALPWAFDSPEFILPAVLASPAVNFVYSYLSPLTQLSRGPQYLRKLHGQTEFLTLITKTFEGCWKCFEGGKKTALGIWWLRFERWIHLLDKLELGFLPEDRKPAKSFFKEFLKIGENRNNLLYYLEYSLLEFNLGDTESSIKTLKTLISSQQSPLSLPEEEKGIVTSAYRTLCEILIGAKRTSEALDLLINLGSGNPVDSQVSIHTRSAAQKKFEQINAELIEGMASTKFESFEDLLLPSFTVEWISCYFWFIALFKEPVHLKNCYKQIFDSMEKFEGVLADQTRECLWETVLAVSWIFEKRNLLFIKYTLRENFMKFPKNLKILSFMADVTIQNNEYWWAVKKTFLSAPTSLSCTFLACLALDRFEKDKENFQNRVRNLFHTMTLEEGKLSSVIHCLRARYLYENENFLLEDALLHALDSCPWNKSIYMESILLLPSNITHLTDVLIEKELRIHITPDEIQEMRD